MKGMFPNLRSLIPTLLIISINSAVQGQIVTPSLDPSTKVRTAAASSWRYLGSNNTLDKNRTATVALFTQSGKGDNKPGSKSWHVSNSGGILLARIGNFNMEAYSESSLKEIEWLDGTTQDNKTSESRYHLAFLTDNLSIGGSLRTHTETDGTADESTQTGQSLSVGYQMGSSFFVSLGKEAVNRTQTGVASNDWVNLTWGFAFISGDPKGTQMRLESSYLNSDESIATASGQTTHNHRKNRTVKRSVEFKMGNFLLSLFRENRGESRYNTSSYKIETELSRIGVLQVDDEGLVVGGYWVVKDETTNGATERTISTRAHLGYNF